MLANRGDPDQTPRSVASGLGNHCLPMSHKKDAGLKLSLSHWYPGSGMVLDCIDS